MEKFQTRRVQAQRRIAHGQRLRAAQLSVWQINRIAAHRKSQMLQMHPDLVRPPRQRSRFQQLRAIAQPP